MRNFILLALSLAFVWSTNVLADTLPEGFEHHILTGPTKAVTEAGVTTFHVDEGKCSTRDYGDGRGESDCSNGNVKSTIRKSKDQKLGQSLEYRFDLWVDPNFSYGGFYNDHSIGFRANGWDSRLRIASWEGHFIHDFIYMLKLDSRRGVTFMANDCQPPEQFGEWMSFSLKVHWAKDASGWAVASCNDKVVYLQEGSSTNQQTQCYITNECEPGVVHDPRTFNYVLGLALNGFGPEYKKYGLASPFAPIPGDQGLTIKMRNIAVLDGATLYGPYETTAIKNLQQILNALGCDVGTPDGVAGKRTKAIALTCRTFGDGEMPKQFDLSTLGTILALYQREGVEQLPRSSL